MKKLILVLMISASAIISMAQTKKTTVGGYGAATAELTKISGDPALSLGGNGGIILNHKWVLGLSGSNILFNEKSDELKIKYQFNYYGLYSEYRFIPERKVNVSIGLTGAMGWLEQESRNADGEMKMKKEGDFTYVIQPKVGINVTVTKFMQVQVYGSYRFSGDTNVNNFSSKALNGTSAGVGLFFGSF
jgi:hypothetical protein